MRVLFWGTPEFAVPPLRALLGEGMDVVGVVTQPDKPVGRSRKLTPPPVKEVALAERLRVLQPTTPKDDEFVSSIRALKPDISIVVAYGHLLPQRVIDLPRLGTLNIHASLLPVLRGAAPIQGAIRQGLPETGVSIMRMVQALDAGPVILQVRTPIPEDETYGELQLRLSELGALALIEALALITIGEATETPQDELRATYAPNIDHQTTHIDWSLPARDVARLIRAYDPKPGAHTTREGVEIKCFGPTILDGVVGYPGEVLPSPFPVSKAGTSPALVVACGTGAVAIAQVQPAGKRRMASSDWVRGRAIAPGDRFGA